MANSRGVSRDVVADGGVTRDMVGDRDSRGTDDGLIKDCRATREHLTLKRHKKNLLSFKHSSEKGSDL